MKVRTDALPTEVWQIGAHFIILPDMTKDVLTVIMGQSNAHCKQTIHTIPAALYIFNVMICTITINPMQIHCLQSQLQDFVFYQIAWS